MDILWPVDKRFSPFAPGAGTPPFYLAGRQSLIEDFDITMYRLERGRSGAGPLITGPRGSGKTVLLNALAAQARARGWYVGRSEVIPTAPLSALIALIAHEALHEMSRGNRVTEGVRRALGVLKAFTSVSAMGVSLSIDVDAVRGKADTGIFEHDLRQLIAELGQLAKSQGTGVAFILDEVQALPEREFDALNSALHDAAQQRLPVTLVSAGLFPSWQSGKSRSDPSRVTTYAGRVSTNTFTRLEPLSDHDSRLALMRTIEFENASFEPYALDQAVRFCEGSCWLLQLLGETAWIIADRSPIDDRAVEAAERAVDAKLAEVFFPRLLRGLESNDVLLLAEIARRGPAPALFRDIFPNSAADRDLEKAAANIVAFLAGHDLVVCYPPGGYIGHDFMINFSVPRLGEYLRRRGVISGRVDPFRGMSRQEALLRRRNW